MKFNKKNNNQNIFKKIKIILIVNLKKNKKLHILNVFTIKYE